MLLPGTSPVGLRLPLDSIAWTPPPGRPETRAVRAPSRRCPTARTGPRDAAGVTPVEDAPTTALAVEARDGHLFVFLPPLDEFDDAVELLAAIESAAAELGVAGRARGLPAARRPARPAR